MNFGGYITISSSFRPLEKLLPQSQCLGSGLDKEHDILSSTVVMRLSSKVAPPLAWIPSNLTCHKKGPHLTITILVLDLKTGKKLHTLKGHQIACH